MDLDALTAARRQEWDRLRELGRSGPHTGREVDEFVALYQSGSADLADIKTSAGRVLQGDVVSTLLSNGRVRMTKTASNPLRFIPRFFELQLPAALYRLRWSTLVIAVAFILVATLVAFWVSGDPALVATLGAQSDLEHYSNESFVDYYNPAAEFAGMVWTNNSWIALQCVLFGITGFWPVVVLVQNATGVGQMAAVLMSFDRGDVFILHILPHGLLELTCIFVAAAAGLQIFWAVLAPGRRTRAAAVARAGLSMVTVAVGLVLALAVAGLIEGFVTGQPWPWWLKIGIGALALAGFLFYMLFVGRRAVRLGEDGAGGEDETGTPVLVAG